MIIGMIIRVLNCFIFQGTFIDLIGVNFKIGFKLGFEIGGSAYKLKRVRGLIYWESGDYLVVGCDHLMYYY